MSGDKHGQYGSISRALLTAIFASFPELEGEALLSSGSEGDESDGLSVCIDIRSPTGDAGRMITIFLSRGDPSLAYGSTHIHASPDTGGITEILDLIGKICVDRIVIAEEIDAQPLNYGTWLDLTDHESVADELTSPYSSGKYQLKSWTGAEDRILTVSDLQI